MAGSQSVRFELGTCSTLACAFGGCVRAFVRAFVRSLVRMHKYVGWDGDGGRVRVTIDGLRIWAEQVDRTRRADKPSLGGLRWFSSG